MNAAPERMLRTAACSLLLRCGMASWVRKTGPRRLTSMDFCRRRACTHRWVGPARWRRCDDDVDRAELLDGPAHQLGDVVEVSDVGGDADGLAAEGTQGSSVSLQASALRLATTTFAPAEM